MMCNKCGTSNVDNAKFCARCGNSLGVSYSNQPVEAKDGCFIDGMKRWSDFDGRATRSQYWCFVLFEWLIIIAFVFIGVIIKGNDEEPNLALILLISVPYLIMLVPSIAIQTRRLHDSNKSGWMQLLLLIPYIGALIILVINLLPSDKGSNRYGVDGIGAKYKTTNEAPSGAQYKTTNEAPSEAQPQHQSNQRSQSTTRNQDILEKMKNMK